MLKCLAEAHPRKDSPSGRLFRRLVQSFAEQDHFFEAVLPQIWLPTQDGSWRLPQDVAQSPFGVARSHRIVADLRIALRLDHGEPDWQEANGELIPPGESSVSVLAPYFKPWANRLEHSAVGAFLSLLGNGKDDATLKFAECWLGTDINAGLYGASWPAQMSSAGRTSVYSPPRRWEANRSRRSTSSRSHPRKHRDDDGRSRYHLR